MASQNRLGTSEDVNGEKWDRCLTDTIVKTGWTILFSNLIDYFRNIILASGLALGIVFSAVLFKRKYIF
jgi:hypothetical protein